MLTNLMAEGLCPGWHCFLSFLNGQSQLAFPCLWTEPSATGLFKRFGFFSGIERG
jgi:hypothetical protein